MVMLPKAEMETVTGAIPVEKLRPISVFPIHYRLLSSSMARKAETRQWLSDLVPAAAYGAIMQRTAAGALACLKSGFDQPGAILVSCDMQQCFDNTSPESALLCLRQSGFPPEWCALLNWTWAHQQRWLQLDGECESALRAVQRSIPQGCPVRPWLWYACWRTPREMSFVLQRRVELLSMPLL